MVNPHILLCTSCPSLIKPLLLSPTSLGNIIKRYSQRKEEDGHGHGMEERARSTAEEFSRVAKKKAESMTQTAKEALEVAKETTAVESDSLPAKLKYKETIEKGNYDKVGEDY